MQKGMLVTVDRQKLQKVQKNIQDKLPKCGLCFNAQHKDNWTVAECRHTLCDTCASKLKKRDIEGNIICPFCRETANFLKLFMN